MTLNNKSWLKNEIFRQYISGDSQEKIAEKLKISVGTVNTFVNEILKSDDTIELQRQLAIIAKKNGVSIKQMAVNSRWKNIIKESSLDDRKIEKFLDAMEMLFNKYDMTPSTAANQFFSLIETMQKENIEPHRLEEVIKSKSTELQIINAQIETSKKLLDESRTKVEKEQKELKIKEKGLDQFRQVSNMLELYGYPEISEEYGNVARAMIDIKKLGYDPKVIVSKYKQMESLTRTNEKLEAQLQRKEKILESYRQMQKKAEDRWKDNYNAFESFSSLVKVGLKEEDIFNVANVIIKDFPGNAISELIEDVRTYGSLKAAAWKLQREFDAENEVML